MKIEITQDLLRELFDYDDGCLIWRSGINRRLKGMKAGWLSKRASGNLRKSITIYGKHYRLHRMVFLWHNGYLPEFVDHANRDTLDDRIENLRAATRSENNSNRAKRKTKGRSIYLGVWPHCKNNSWIACVRKGNKSYIKYGFKTQEKAALAYNQLAIIHHKEFANLNIIKP